MKTYSTILIIPDQHASMGLSTVLKLHVRISLEQGGYTVQEPFGIRSQTPLSKGKL